MIRSMTGYAAASAQTPRGALAIEMKSVNSRFLDLQFRVAEELRGAEPLLRELITVRIARGKVDCRLALGGGAAAAAPRPLNAQALAELKRLAGDASRAFPEAAPLDLADVLRWPGVLADAPVDEDAIRAAVEGLARRALDELCAAREREGAKLAAVILERVAQMRQRVAQAAPLVPEAIAAWKARVIERLREAQVNVDEERIRAELAVQAARSDVDEELTRLTAHLAEVERVLGKGGAAGKRLDFLAQELNREANTLASKAQGLALADCALELKLLIEQVREQVQNIE
ncbi:MAG: YicC/YloC family endoribonuclease [Betaproteobacteria bacterium]